MFELFPGTELWRGEATDTGFVCECYFPHPVNPETLHLIEERMKLIVKEKRPIRTLEMTPRSAFELFKKEGHETQCQILEEIEGNLVEVIEIGSFHQMSEGPHLKNTSELGAFKLQSLEKLPDRGVKIDGAASFSKEELKEFLKKLSDYEHSNYQAVGQRMGYWKSFNEGLVWFEKGLQARSQVQNIFFQEVPLIQCSGDFEPLLAQLKRDCRQINPGTTKDLRDSLYSIQKISFTTEGEFLNRMNSSLHSIYKILIMLGFDCWVRVCGKRRDWKGIELSTEMKEERVEGPQPRIDFRVEDPILRPITVATIKMSKSSSEKNLSYDCEAFVERILVLLLEKNLRIPHFSREPEPR